MSYGSKKEYIQTQRRRYRRAGRSFKTQLLDEVCEVCGYEQKYAIKLLGHPKRCHKCQSYLLTLFLKETE